MQSRTFAVSSGSRNLPDHPGTPAVTSPFLSSPSETQSALTGAGYIADYGLATAVMLAHRLRRPLLIEGEPGVGKTALASAIARASGRQLIRLQCYEGIDASEALYEWNWAKQLLVARRADGTDAPDLYAEGFLLERPVLKALRAGASSVLLIDEIDRADEAFDAFLLEVLSEYTVSIPEFGTVEATVPPVVVLTSNRTRELHDALTRRTLYHWIDYPDIDRETAIIASHVDGIPDDLARSVAEVVSTIRELDLVKRPGAAEAIDWARALTIVAAGRHSLGADWVEPTLGAAVKHHEDVAPVRALLRDIL